MRAGRLDRRITIQRRTLIQSGSGATTEVWSDLATRWASVHTIRGEERYADPQLAAKGGVEFIVRYGSAIADLGPLDRVQHGGRVYDITAVREIGRYRWLAIDATVRTDIELYLPSLDFSDARNSQYSGQVV